MLARLFDSYRRHRRPVSLSMLGAVSSVALLVACADAPTGPSVAPSTSLLSTTTSTVTSLTRLKVDALLRDEPLATAQTRSWTVRSATGGTLEWPELGLEVVVPAHAFDGKEMTITITALAGDVIAYDFGPDGTRFDRPLTIVQSLKGTNHSLLRIGTRLRGAYFKDASQVNDASNTAIVNELLPTLVDLLGQTVRFDVDHFSGYMVSTD